MNKSSGIGGQAVLEGIMMKNKERYAVAVRKADSEIEVAVNQYRGVTDRCRFLNIPFIRGIFNFIDSMVLGIKSLTFSAAFYEEETEPGEKIGDKVSRKLFKEKAEAFLMGFTVFISVLLAVGLFIVLPYYLSEFIKSLFHIEKNTVVALIEGIVRIVIFILYIVLISFMKDIQRTYMYHGAEHKCINCIENGKELNVENVRSSSRKHKRCGTSFILFVVVLSIICFIIVSSVLPSSAGMIAKAGIRLLLVPIIAGISYEIIKLAGRCDNMFVRIISAPGMALQRLTTKEPDDDMIEVAIKAVEAVFDWKEYIANYVPDEDISSEEEVSDEEPSSDEDASDEDASDENASCEDASYENASDEAAFDKTGDEDDLQGID